MLSAAGVAKVLSSLLIDEADERPIIVTKYIEDVESNNVANLPRDARQSAAASLGRLMTSHRWFLPSAEAFQKDAFVASEGEPVLIDVDPYLKPRHYPLDGGIDTGLREAAQKAFMLKGAEIIDTWCTDETDLRVVASAFVREIGALIDDQDSLGIARSKYFGVPHLMSNGFPYDVARTFFVD